MKCVIVLNNTIFKNVILLKYSYILEIEKYKKITAYNLKIHDIFVLVFIYLTIKVLTTRTSRFFGLSLLFVNNR